MVRPRSVAALLLVLAVSACSQAAVVAEKDLEKSVSDRLAEQVGVAPDAVDCPGDLEGVKGEEMRCTLTAGPDELGLTVTVTGVDTEGQQVDYEVQVDG